MNDYIEEAANERANYSGDGTNKWQRSIDDAIGGQRHAGAYCSMLGAVGVVSGQ